MVEVRISMQKFFIVLDIIWVDTVKRFSQEYHSQYNYDILKEASSYTNQQRLGSQVNWREDVTKEDLKINRRHT